MNRLLLVLVAASLGSIGCVHLPAIPIQVVAKPPAEAFTGPGKCRVRIDPLIFDPNALWGGQPEAAFIATLRPEAQQSHEGDKVGTVEMYKKQIDLNERDYIGQTGSVTTNPGGDVPFALRSRVVSVDTRSGVTDVVHELFALPSGQKIGELRLAANNVGFGLGQQLRNSMINQAWAVLKYLGDHFACNGPARVVD